MPFNAAFSRHRRSRVALTYTGEIRFNRLNLEGAKQKNSHFNLCASKNIAKALRRVFRQEHELGRLHQRNAFHHDAPWLLLLSCRRALALCLARLARRRQERLARAEPLGARAGERARALGLRRAAR